MKMIDEYQSLRIDDNFSTPPDAAIKLAAEVMGLLRDGYECGNLWLIEKTSDSNVMKVFLRVPLIKFVVHGIQGEDWWNHRVSASFRHIGLSEAELPLDQLDSYHIRSGVTTDLKNLENGWIYREFLNATLSAGEPQDTY